jgi:curved DNA-binding protein CbpA
VSAIPKGAAEFQDYYEVLQLSPNADPDTITRVYHVLVKRYHPDNKDTGNTDKFHKIVEAYKLLSDPDQRVAYDVRHDENRATTLKIFDEASADDSFESDRRILDAILSLLFVSRRRDPERGGIGVIQMERLLGCPAAHLEFHLWYLREKGWIHRLDNGLLAITVAGVDKVIEQDKVIIRRDRLISEIAGSESGSNGGSNGHSNVKELLGVR